MPTDAPKSLSGKTAGLRRLTPLYFDLSGAPKLASVVADERESKGGGGLSDALSGLKTLLETVKYARVFP